MFIHIKYIKKPDISQALLKEYNRNKIFKN